MATYFHGNSEIQTATPDGLQTLVLMNPTGYIPYSDTPPPPTPSPAAGNLIFLNSATAAAAAAASLAHHHHHAATPQHAQHFVTAANNSSDLSALHHGFLPQRVHYNLWTPPPDASPAARDTPRAAAAAAAQQGLSLTLSSQQLGFGSPPTQSHAPPPVSGEDMRVSGGSSSSVSVSGVTNGVPGIQSVLLSSKYLKAAQELLEEVVNVGSGIGAEAAKKGGGGGNRAVGESSGAGASGEGSGAAGSGSGEGSGKRAAELTPAERQEVQMKKAKLISMLDEVEQRYRQYHHQMQIVISSFEQAAGIGSARTYTALALQTISKQFRCLKDAITSQIRAANKSLGEEDCLGGGGGGKIEGSRLKFVDHHLRQQRALQQLGMIQQNAWRPQRGLPERSVSVLRAWLFEHFLHPYPKDSDKHMLAKQTGLTRSQVSNWFINARVRLWKPMVEEMYLEEIKEQEQNGSGAEKTSKSNNDSDSKSKEKSPANGNSNAENNQTASFASKQDSNNPSSVAAGQQFVPSGISMSRQPSASPAGGPRNLSAGFSLIGSSDLLDGITQSSPKKARCDSDMLHSPNSHVPSISMDVKPGKLNNNNNSDNNNNNNNSDHLSMKFVDERQGRDGYSFMGVQTNFIGGFGQYPIGEIGRFDAEQFTPRFSGNGVSLTLGLPHCENHHLSLAGGGAHQSFVPSQTIQLGRRVDHHIGEANHEFGAINTSPHTHPHHSSAAAAAFESINIQNPKRFAAQLLPDYVS